MIQVHEYLLPPQIPLCSSVSDANYTINLANDSTAAFVRNEKSPNSLLSGLPRSIVNQFCFCGFRRLCLAGAPPPCPFHPVFGFQLFGPAVLLYRGGRTIRAMRLRAAALGVRLKGRRRGLRFAYSAESALPPDGVCPSSALSSSGRVSSSQGTSSRRPSAV